MRFKKIIKGISMLAIFTGGIFYSTHCKAESLENNSWTYNERYRNQYHYSAKENWLNDPNGLLYDDTTDTYHMFYQYNPDNNEWGNMSWGHATSKDLINWQEQAVAIPELKNQEWVDFTYTNTEGELAQHGEVRYVGKPTTNWGNAPENGKKYIFSGSAILDKENKSGLGKNAILAFYTSCYQVATRKNDGNEGGWGSWLGMSEIQEQHLAYSTDGGKTFQQYSPDGNSAQPKAIIPVTDLPKGDAKDFRDPKVVYDQENEQWLMVVVAGQKAEIYKSTNLLNWQHASTIVRKHDYGTGVWECPELIPMKVAETGETKWVLTMSVQDNAYASGSGMQYMIGDLDRDGKWTPQTENTLAQPQWLDYGEDFYAGVTFGNMPNDRKVMLAWMSNWKYVGEQSTTPWYSHMTLPRELSLHTDGQGSEGYKIIQQPIKETSTLNKETIQLETTAGTTLQDQEAKVTNFTGRTYRLDTEFTWDNGSKPDYLGVYIRATDNLERKIYLGYDTNNQLAYINRLSTGEPNLEGPVRDKTNAPIKNEGKIKFTAFIDESAIEVFVNDGERTITQVFYFRPELIGDIATNSLAFYSQGGTMNIAKATVTPLRSIFGEIQDGAPEITIDQDADFNPLKDHQFTSITGSGQSEPVRDVKVINNTVDARTPGQYTVKYGVTNAQGKYQEMEKVVKVNTSTSILPDEIKLNYSGLKTIKIGSELQLSAELLPATSSAAIEWKSNKPDTVSIDELGNIKALKTGTVRITAQTSNQKKATLTIRVTA